MLKKSETSEIRAGVRNTVVYGTKRKGFLQLQKKVGRYPITGIVKTKPLTTQCFPLFFWGKIPGTVLIKEENIYTCEFVDGLNKCYKDMDPHSKIIALVS